MTNNLHSSLIYPLQKIWGYSQKFYIPTTKGMFRFSIKYRFLPSGCITQKDTALTFFSHCSHRGLALRSQEILDTPEQGHSLLSVRCQGSFRSLSGAATAGGKSTQSRKDPSPFMKQTPCHTLVLHCLNRITLSLHATHIHHDPKHCVLIPGLRRTLAAVI